MTTEALPASMLARLEALGAELLACARQHRDASLVTLERAVLERVRAAQGGLLEEVLERSTTSLRSQQARVRLACPGCGERARVQDWRARRVRTVLGRIRFARPWYVCAGCRYGWSPAGATLELEPRARLSVGLQAWVGDLGAETAFRQARWLLAELTGQPVSKETIRRHSQRPPARRPSRSTRPPANYWSRLTEQVRFAGSRSPTWTAGTRSRSGCWPGTSTAN